MIVLNLKYKYYLSFLCVKQFYVAFSVFLKAKICLAIYEPLLEVAMNPWGFCWIYEMLATSLMVKSVLNPSILGSTEADPKTTFCVQVIYYRNVQGKLEKDGGFGQKEEGAKEGWSLRQNSTEGSFVLVLCGKLRYKIQIRVVTYQGKGTGRENNYHMLVVGEHELLGIFAQITFLQAKRLH